MYRIPEKLDIKLISGHDLAIKDITGSSDPYCVVTLLNFKRKTKPIKQNLNPVWNQPFQEIGIKKEDLINNKEALVIDVWDYDFLSPTDDFMGRAILSGEEIASCNTEKEFILKLYPRNSNDDGIKGDIKISVCYEDFNFLEESTYNDLLVKSRYEKPTFNKVCDAFMRTKTQDNKLNFREFFKKLDHWVMLEKADLYSLWGFDMKNCFYKNKLFVSELGEHQFFSFLEELNYFPNGTLEEIIDFLASLSDSKKRNELFLDMVFNKQEKIEIFHFKFFLDYPFYHLIKDIKPTEDGYIYENRVKLTKEEFSSVEERFRTDFRYEYLNTIEEVLDRPIESLTRNEYQEFLQNDSATKLINTKFLRVFEFSKHREVLKKRISEIEKKLKPVEKIEPDPFFSGKEISLDQQTTCTRRRVNLYLGNRYAVVFNTGGLHLGNRIN